MKVLFTNAISFSELGIGVFFIYKNGLYLKIRTFKEELSDEGNYTIVRNALNIDKCNTTTFNNDTKVVPVQFELNISIK